MSKNKKIKEESKCCCCCDKDEAPASVKEVLGYTFALLGVVGIALLFAVNIINIYEGFRDRRAFSEADGKSSYAHVPASVHCDKNLRLDYIVPGYKLGCWLGEEIDE